MQVLKTIVNTISYLIAPPYCEWCKQFLTAAQPLCVACTERIFPVVSQDVQVTQTFSMSVYAAGKYHDPLKSLILAKARSYKVAAYHLATIIWQKTPLQYIDFDYIVPVPLHWSRYAYRGYNQAEIIAQGLSKKSGKPILHCLKRIKRTPFLSFVKKEERYDMVKEAFLIIPGHDLTNKKIVLVDDVMTTGATLRAAAKLIRKHKPAAIKAVVAART